MRVRKLARELRGSSGDVLGLLHELGLGRYRSPEDMLSSAVVDKVRVAWSKGQRGTPVRVAPRQRPKPKPKPPPDLMAHLVPGVVPDVDAPLHALATEADGAGVLDELRAALDEERKALERARQALSDAEQAVERERNVLAEAQGGLHAREQALLDAENAEPEASPPDPDSLVAVLEARGLRGADEFERALGALAESRRARELLSLLSVTDRDAALLVLDRALMLVGGELPDDLPSGVAGVRVAPERAELPGWEDLRRAMARVGELLLLHGRRHVVVVGGRPAWQRLARAGIDPRVELRFQPPGVLAREADERVDLVALWSDNGEDALGWPDRALVVQIDGDDLPALVRAFRAALED